MWLEDCDEFNRFAEQAGKHTRTLADRLIQIHHSRLKELTPAKGQELPSQIAGPSGVRAHVLYVFAQRSIGSEPLEEQVGVAGNHSQQVIEVVGDSSGESAE